MIRNSLQDKEDIPKYRPKTRKPVTRICRHRFEDELIPSWPVKHLFVGTFNPEWSGGNDAPYFYGRPQNSFWTIMPESLGLESQSKKRTDPRALRRFLRKNKIGLTDIVHSLEGADQNNPAHRKAVLGFKDDDLCKFGIVLNEDMFSLISKNKRLLAQGGVFLTRKTCPPGKMKPFWNQITRLCDTLGIRSGSLISPSNRVGKYTSKEKIRLWRGSIF